MNSFSPALSVTGTTSIAAMALLLSFCEALFRRIILAGTLAEAAGVAVTAGVVGKLRHPGITLGHLGGVADVKHSRALRHGAGLCVIGLAELVPEVIGDAEIALLIVEVVPQMLLLDALQEGVLRRRVEM